MCIRDRSRFEVAIQSRKVTRVRDQVPGMVCPASYRIWRLNAFFARNHRTRPSCTAVRAHTRLVWGAYRTQKTEYEYPSRRFGRCQTVQTRERNAHGQRAYSNAAAHRAVAAVRVSSVFLRSSPQSYPTELAAATTAAAADPILSVT